MKEVDDALDISLGLHDVCPQKLVFYMYNPKIRNKF